MLVHGAVSGPVSCSGALARRNKVLDVVSAEIPAAHRRQERAANQRRALHSLVRGCVAPVEKRMAMRGAFAGREATRELCY